MLTDLDSRPLAWCRPGRGRVGGVAGSGWMGRALRVLTQRTVQVSASRIAAIGAGCVQRASCPFFT